MFQCMRKPELRTARRPEFIIGGISLSSPRPVELDIAPLISLSRWKCNGLVDGWSHMKWCFVLILKIMHDSGPSILCAVVEHVVEKW